MFQVSDVVQLNAGEKVQTLVRVHSAYLWGKLTVAGLLVIIPFFFLFSLLRAGAIGIVVFAACTGVGIVLALRSFFLWDAQVLILTDQRVVYVIQRSLWHRLVSEAALDTIRDLQWEQANMVERLLHCGTVRIKTGASSVPDMTVPRIPGPEELVRAIKSLREQGGGKGSHHPTKEVAPEVSLDERREHVHAWVSEANAETLKKLEQLMHEDRSHHQKT
jgi:hypothetical protein